MTKKDYELIAMALKEAREIADEPGHPHTRYEIPNVAVLRLSRSLDRAKFLRACGLEV